MSGPDASLIGDRHVLVHFNIGGSTTTLPRLLDAGGAGHRRHPGEERERSAVTAPAYQSVRNYVPDEFPPHEMESLVVGSPDAGQSLPGGRSEQDGAAVRTRQAPLTKR